MGFEALVCIFSRSRQLFSGISVLLKGDHHTDRLLRTSLLPPPRNSFSVHFLAFLFAFEEEKPHSGEKGNFVAMLVALIRNFTGKVLLRDDDDFGKKKRER
ncbi:hypothetical protein CDAR_407561 [Caerostris darwini]|uniref:Uncharacterized protein n=1 Tax=Caerostris darwini TaxID=1538125 RepID=A0AAV4Q0X6_9ARAC|nr:hypothetical protein CDAR_407561 [Caerostris darwini]